MLIPIDSSNFFNVILVVDAGAIEGTGSPLVMYAEAGSAAVARAGGNKN